MFDLDGTLAPFRLDPAAVRLSQRAAMALARLAGRRPVAIISGRPLAFLRRITEGLPLVLLGSHGAESSVPRLVTPPPKLRSAALERVLREAARKGLRVERKPFGYAIHFRALAEAERAHVTAAWATRLEAALPAGFALLRGNAVLEARPAAMNKGAALPALRAKFGLPIAAVLGDDTTDEDMFAALHAGEMGVLVGERRRSLARYHLPGVAAAGRYLAILGR